MPDLFEQDAVKMETNVATIVGDSSLYEKVLASGNIEVLERFLAAKTKEEDRQSRIEFDKHFSEMQAEFKPVARNGEVWNKAKTSVLYKFCPLEDILKVYAPIIAKHNFSYYWTEEAIEGNQAKRISCHVNGYGHERSAYIDIPIQAGNEFTNSIQQRGVSTTYGKRYSFVNAFGVIIDDEDDDAAIFDINNVLNYATELKAINDAKDLAELNTAFQAAYKLAGDNDGRKIITSAKDARKKELAK